MKLHETTSSYIKFIYLKKLIKLKRTETITKKYTQSHRKQNL